jgi:hypothetical protein
VRIKTSWVTVLWLAGFGAWLLTTGCDKPEAPQKPVVSAADKAAADKAAKAAADKAEADKVAGIKAAADKAAADKVAADKAAADKVAMVKAAADKVAADEKTAAASLPADLVEFKAEITRAVAQIDMTTAKLDVLSASTGNLKQPSQDALAAIEGLDKEAQGLKKRADSMRDRGAAYFEAWETQLAAMSTPGVVAIATKRKDELAAKYAEVLTAMQEGRSAFDSFWTDLQAVQKAVEDGVTPESQKTLAPQIQATKEKATTLKGRIEAVTSKLHQVTAIYTKP